MFFCLVSRRRYGASFSSGSDIILRTNGINTVHAILSPEADAYIGTIIIADITQVMPSAIAVNSVAGTIILDIAVLIGSRIVLQRQVIESIEFNQTVRQVTINTSPNRFARQRTTVYLAIPVVAAINRKESICCRKRNRLAVLIIGNTVPGLRHSRLPQTIRQVIQTANGIFRNTVQCKGGLKGLAIIQPAHGLTDCKFRIFDLVGENHMLTITTACAVNQRVFIILRLTDSSRIILANCDTPISVEVYLVIVNRRNVAFADKIFAGLTITVIAGKTLKRECRRDTTLRVICIVPGGTALATCTVCARHVERKRHRSTFRHRSLPVLSIQPLHIYGKGEGFAPDNLLCKIAQRAGTAISRRRRRIEAVVCQLIKRILRSFGISRKWLGGFSMGVIQFRSIRHIDADMSVLAQCTCNLNHFVTVLAEDNIILTVTVTAVVIDHHFTGERNGSAEFNSAAAERIIVLYRTAVENESCVFLRIDCAALIRLSVAQRRTRLYSQARAIKNMDKTTVATVGKLGVANFAVQDDILKSQSSSRCISIRSCDCKQIPSIKASAYNGGRQPVDAVGGREGDVIARREYHGIGSRDDIILEHLNLCVSSVVIHDIFHCEIERLEFPVSDPANIVGTGIGNCQSLQIIRETVCPGKNPDQVVAAVTLIHRLLDRVIEVSGGQLGNLDRPGFTIDI